MERQQADDLDVKVGWDVRDGGGGAAAEELELELELELPSVRLQSVGIPKWLAE